MNEIPVVRHFVACLEVVTAGGTRSLTLRDLIHVIGRKPGEPFPCIRQTMTLYGLLTNGRGEHEFAVELTVFDHGAERRVHLGPAVRVDLGQDPAAVHGLPIPLRNVVFPEAGQYTFHLLCDGRAIAEEKILVR